MAEFILPTDPDSIPIRVINAITVVSIAGGLVHLELATARLRPLADGKLDPDHIVAARIRFDLEMARLIRNAIDAQIALLTPPDTKAN